MAASEADVDADDYARIKRMAVYRGLLTHEIRWHDHHRVNLGPPDGIQAQS
jgi:hypothetical protein